MQIILEEKELETHINTFLKSKYFRELIQQKLNDYEENEENGENSIETVRENITVLNVGKIEYKKPRGRPKGRKNNNFITIENENINLNI